MGSPWFARGSDTGSRYTDGRIFPGSSSPLQVSMENAMKQSWESVKVERKYPEKKDAYEYLEEHLKAIAESREPDETDDASRWHAIERLNALIRDAFPPPSLLGLVPYGSFLSSCYSPGSDLDLALCGLLDERLLVDGWRRSAKPTDLDKMPEWQLHTEAPALLQRLADVLESSGAATGGRVTCIFAAKVPIIKFIESRSGIECDICVTTRGCDFKGAVMRELHCLQPDLAPLIRLVKLWAKHHDINSARAGTTSSWTLSLMMLFSLQTFPEGGPLLPPLWRLFHDEEPNDLYGKGRPLQDKSLKPDAMLAAMRERCSPEHAARLLPPRKDPNTAAGTPPPGLLEQLLWFLSSFTAITGQWRDNEEARNWRVSPWLGRSYVKPFTNDSGYRVPYLLPVEEAFHNNDNTGRSVGVPMKTAGALPYIVWVFEHSTRVLGSVQDSKDAARALAWLFGPEALPVLGLTALQVSPSIALPIDLALVAKQLAAAAKGPGGEERRSPANPVGSGAAGAQSKSLPPPPPPSPPPVQEEEEEEGEGDDEEVKRKKKLAFRALIDATRAGSPITTLEEWRLYRDAHNGSKPPLGWHDDLPLPPPQTQTQTQTQIQIQIQTQTQQAQHGPGRAPPPPDPHPLPLQHRPGPGPSPGPAPPLPEQRRYNPEDPQPQHQFVQQHQPDSQPAGTAPPPRPAVRSPPPHGPVEHRRQVVLPAGCYKLGNTVFINSTIIIKTNGASKKTVRKWIQQLQEAVEEVVPAAEEADEAPLGAAAAAPAASVPPVAAPAADTDTAAKAQRGPTPANDPPTPCTTTTALAAVDDLQTLAHAGSSNGSGRPAAIESAAAHKTTSAAEAPLPGSTGAAADLLQQKVVAGAAPPQWPLQAPPPPPPQQQQQQGREQSTGGQGRSSNSTTGGKGAVPTTTLTTPTAAPRPTTTGAPPAAVVSATGVRSAARRPIPTQTQTTGIATKPSATSKSSSAPPPPSAPIVSSQQRPASVNASVNVNAKVKVIVSATAKPPPTLRGGAVQLSVNRFSALAAAAAAADDGDH